MAFKENKYFYLCFRKILFFVSEDQNFVEIYLIIPTENPKKAFIFILQAWIS